MNIPIKICGVALLVVIPMVFGLAVSAALSFIIRKPRKQDDQA